MVRSLIECGRWPARARPTASSSSATRRCACSRRRGCAARGWPTSRRRWGSRRAASTTTSRARRRSSTGSSSAAATTDRSKRPPQLPIRTPAPARAREAPPRTARSGLPPAPLRSGAGARAASPTRAASSKRVVRELYERVERSRRSMTVVERSAIDLPALFQIYFVDAAPRLLRALRALHRAASGRRPLPRRRRSRRRRARASSRRSPISRATASATTIPTTLPDDARRARQRDPARRREPDLPTRARRRRSHVKLPIVPRSSRSPPHSSAANRRRRSRPAASPPAGRSTAATRAARAIRRSTRSPARTCAS